ncbi:MAG: DUF1289 domain-containing protein [Gammaproteobacteria bacterium]
MSVLPAEPAVAGADPASAPERPDTPCVAVCSTTFDDVCRGCGRTYIEVAQWVAMSREEKEVVWQRILAQGYPRRNT